MLVGATGGRVERSPAFLVVVLVALSRMPPTANAEVDCREMGGYTSGPVPDTCTVELTLSDTEMDIIDSLRAKCQDFPFNCRRKYILRTLSSWIRKKSN